MLSISIKSTSDYKHQIAQRAKQKRLLLNLSQSGLARRSGVSLGSIKRFEGSGDISLVSLLKLALVLDALKEFDDLFQSHPVAHLDALLQTAPTRKRGMKT